MTVTIPFRGFRTLAQIRKGIHPAPVYEAHFADGSRQRMSFWTPQPLDPARGRRLVGSGSRQDKTMTAGFIDHGGEKTIDPFFTDEPVTTAPPKPSPKKALKALLAAIDLPDADINTAMDDARLAIA